MRLPDPVSFEVGAAMMLKGLTVQYLLRQTYRLQGDETILLHAAAGGVGLIACQWARALGVKVIGTVGSPEKAALAKQHGAWQTIDYSREDVVARVLELTDGKKVPVVYDGVGKDTWEESLDCLQPRGLMVSFGSASGPVTGVSLGILATKGSLYVTRPTLGTLRRDAAEARGRGERALRHGDVGEGDLRRRPDLSARRRGSRARGPRLAQDDRLQRAAALNVRADATAPRAAAVDDATARGTSRVIALLALIAFGSAMSMRVMDAAIPKLSSDFDVTIRQASFVVTVFAIAYGCLQIVFGPSGDRFGKLQVILFACVSGALASVACALAPSFPLLLAARFWAGASMAAMMPLSMAWIGDNVRYEQRQPVLAKFLVGQISGIAAGQAAGGIASDLLSWRAPFVMLALWFVVMVALLFRVVRMPRHRTVRTAGPAPSLVAQCRSVLVRPWARRVLATVFIEGAALYGPFAFFATHLHLKHGLSLSFSGSMLVAFAVGGMSYSFGAGRLVGRLGEAGLARVRAR